MELNVHLSHNDSKIHIEKGILEHVNEVLDFHGKVMIITDSGVPEIYQQILKSQFSNGYVTIIPQGESSKSLEMYEMICKRLLENNFSRKDMIIALGGGVVGDLSGYVAATFKRGMRFSSVPTTTLSMIDSSIGGKVAVNLGKVKNILGTFYHPEHVFIDINTLKTLPIRHYNNGLVEAIKVGLIADEHLFECFEADQLNIEKIIYRSLDIKRNVVEQDEKEQNLRKILNFGHTIGHAIESLTQLHDYYHGECVAMGMLKVIDDEQIRERLVKILQRFNIPLEVKLDIDEMMNMIQKDKKANGDEVTLVLLEGLGRARLVDVKIEIVRNYCERSL